MGSFSAGFYGILSFNAFSYPDVADTRLQETPNSEYPYCKRWPEYENSGVEKS